jgi:hypothetical protein
MGSISRLLKRLHESEADDLNSSHASARLEKIVKDPQEFNKVVVRDIFRVSVPSALLSILSTPSLKAEKEVFEKVLTDDVLDALFVALGVDRHTEEVIKKQKPSIKANLRKMLKKVMGSHEFEQTFFLALEKQGIPTVRNVTQATKYAMLAIQFLPRHEAEDTIRYMLSKSPLSYEEAQRISKGFALS